MEEIEELAGWTGIQELGLAGWLDVGFGLSALAWICYWAAWMWVRRRDYIGGQWLELAWFLFGLFGLPGYLLWILLDIWFV